jgi:hypothetical protein
MTTNRKSVGGNAPWSTARTAGQPRRWRGAARPSQPPMVTWFKCRPNRRVETLTSESAGRETTARVRPAQETTGDGAGEGGEVVSASS